MREVLYEDENILVCSTGDNVDFVATVENKTGNALNLVIPLFDDSEPYFGINSHDWVGLFADNEGRVIQEELSKGRFYIDISSDVRKLSHDEIRSLDRTGRTY